MMNVVHPLDRSRTVKAIRFIGKALFLVAFCAFLFWFRILSGWFG
jgi:hypothetical protein